MANPPKPRVDIPLSAPGPGEFVDIAPGILWMRLPLPFQLNHVNIYLVEDGEGWAMVDTGVGDATSKAIWDRVLQDGLRGRKLTRIIATHHHPDHVGLVGWFSERLGLPVYTSETEFLLASHYLRDPDAVHGSAHRAFYRRHGMSEDRAEAVVERGHRYKNLTTGLPRTFHRLSRGDHLILGGRDFEIHTGAGHSSEQVMLFCREEGIFLAADQVLNRISPNISVNLMDPEGDPLDLYLRSLRELKAEIPADVLTLPGHDMPFLTLHKRIDELSAHHEFRCQSILTACLSAPRTTAEIVAELFPKIQDPHQMSFAFTEILAHMNLLARQGRLAWVDKGENWRASAKGD